MARFGDFDQYLDNAGDPLAEGKLYFYESGTTTPKTTFADINNSIPNTNPVLLSAAGRQPNIFFDGVAKVILTDSDDVQLIVRDPVGETATDFGDEWVATKVYNAVDVVLGSDGVYYRSLINGNQNNNPVTTTGSWALLYSVEWNAGTTYQVGALVTYNDEQYQSLQGTNLNQNPSTQTAYWVLLSFAWLATATYAEDQNAVGTDGVLYTSLQNSNTGNDPATSPTYWVGTSAAAAASAVAAAASAAAALVSENAAELAETNAETAQVAAEAAQAAAETAETNAETAETNSAASAASSATSASESATSAAAALASENAAATSETNSAASAAAAASSASGSSGSASAAAASAAAALVSENASAASASSSAASAATSTSEASDSAASAAASASSATASAGSATAAAGSATAAAGSATAAASSATDAATAETGAEAALEEFEELYLGAKSTAPTVDNQGNPLQAGALYFNTVSNTMFVYSGSSWAAAGSAVNGTAERQEYVATSGQTNFSATYDVGFVDVYLNGSKLIPTTDFTATNGATVILTTGAVTGDNVSIIAYGAFNVADVYTQAQSDARYAQIANVYNKTDSDARYTQKTNNLSDLASAPTALTNLGLTATAAEVNVLDGIPATLTATELGYVDGATSNIQAQINNIDALPSQTGNSGEYLTTNGTVASWAAIPAPSTGSLYLTSANSFTAGDRVYFNNNQAASLTTTINQSISLSSTQTITGGLTALGTPHDGAFDKYGNFAHVARNGSNYLVACIYDYNEATGQFSASSQTTIYSGQMRDTQNAMKIVYNPVADSFWCAFSDTSNYPRVAGFQRGLSGGSGYVANVSQSSIGSNSFGGSHCDIACDESTGTVVGAWHSNPSQNTNLAGFKNVSGTTRTGIFTEKTFGSNSENYFNRIAFDSTNNKYHVAVNYYGTTRFANFTYDGVNSPTVASSIAATGTISSFNSGAANLTQSGSNMPWHKGQSALLFMNDLSTSSLEFTAFVYNNSTNAYSTNGSTSLPSIFGSNYSSYGTNKYNRIVCPFDSDQFYINSGPSLNLASYNGTAITNVAASTVTGGYDYIIAYSSGNFKIALPAFTSNQSRWQLSDAASTDSKAFIGFAGASVSSGVNLEIKSTSAIESNQSGLSAGSQYYIATNGAISTTVSDTRAGKALSATQLLVNVT